MYLPWIGPNYCASPLRILILGESMYEPGFRPDITKGQIIEQIEGRKHGNRFYPRISNAFYGRQTSLEERKHFWNSVAFQNLITTPLKAPRCAPSPEQWEQSLATLPNILAELKPEYVVVLGKTRMWANVSKMPGMKAKPSIKNVGPCGVREFNSVYFHGITHPSGRGFQRNIVNRWLHHAMEQLWEKRKVFSFPSVQEGAV